MKGLAHMKTIKTLASMFFAATLALSAPLAAFAATDITVEDTKYTTAANGTGNGGGTWTWDGQDLLALNNFISDKELVYTGTLTVALTGENEVAAINGEREEIDYSGADTNDWIIDYYVNDVGAANTTITSQDCGTLETGKIDIDGGLNVKNANLTVDYEYTGNAVEFPAAIQVGDLTTENATLEVTATKNVSTAEGSVVNGIRAGSVSFKDSDVNVTVKAAENDIASGIVAQGIGDYIEGATHNLGNVALNNSDVKVSLEPKGVAVTAWGRWMPDGAGLRNGTISIDNSSIAEPDMHVTTITDYYGADFQMLSPVSGSVNGAELLNTEYASWSKTPYVSSGVSVKGTGPNGCGSGCSGDCGNRANYAKLAAANVAESMVHATAKTADDQPIYLLFALAVGAMVLLAFAAYRLRKGNA